MWLASHQPLYTEYPVYGWILVLWLPVTIAAIQGYVWIRRKWYDWRFPKWSSEQQFTFCVDHEEGQWPQAAKSFRYLSELHRQDTREKRYNGR